MVVDDEPLLREMVADVLQSEGYQVVEAANGREALWQLRQGGVRPDLIVLDLMMPVMTGWEFRDEQLRDVCLAAIPVLVVSGSSMGAVRADCRLAKPYTIEALLDAVLACAPDARA